MNPPRVERTETGAPTDLLRQLLAATLSVHGSDLHLRANAPPFVRVAGKLCQTQSPPVTADQIVEVIRMTAPERNLTPDSPNHWEYSFEQPGMARFRAHAVRERGVWGLSMRVIPLTIPSFQDLRLPPVAKALAQHAPGLVLVTGPTGSGKSTTLASMLGHLTTTETVHLVSVEDPVEYTIPVGLSCITQREVGRDVGNTKEALHAALREDPDVLFIGEIRDLPAMETALHAAETGHSVYASFHTQNAVKTVQRMVAMFPLEDQAAARARVADSLRGVMSQMLLPRKGARGRVLVTEVLINNYRVKDCIRDPARAATIPQVLEKSADQLMHTFDQALMALVRDGIVAADVAVNAAASPSDFRRALQMTGVAA